MSRFSICLTPVNGYDIPGLERWLEKQAEKGLMFSMSAGIFALFTHEKPASLRFHLEPARHKTDQDDPELIALYQEAGWTYLDLFRKNFFVFSTPDREAQAHTDPETWNYALKRFFRQKLLGGLGLLIFNFLLLSFYWGHTNLSPFGLRWFPMETISSSPLVALILSVLGLALVDLSWLLGLITLERYQKALSKGKRPPRSAHGGIPLTVGTVLLTVVLAETLILFSNLSYQPYPLEGSGFVTMEEIEGPDFKLSMLWPDYMDYISHSRSLLTPERWHFQEYAWVNRDTSSNDVPYLKLDACRYPLAWLAEKRVEEQERILWNGGKYVPLPPVSGLDQVLMSHDQFDPERDIYPRTRLILRQSNTVLLVEYHGEQNLTQFLPRFAQMLEQL